MLRNLSKVLLSIWNLVSLLYKTWRNKKVIFQSSTKKNPCKKEAETVQEMSEMSSLLCEECGRGLTQKENASSERERGGVTGSKGAWPQLPSWRSWSEGITSLKGQGSNNVWCLRNNYHGITILGKLPRGQVLIEELVAIAFLMRTDGLGWDILCPTTHF